MNPLVTIIVAHHLDENQPYLDQCLGSVMKTEGVAFEVILLSDAKTCPRVPDHVTVVHDPKLDSCTKKFHQGVKLAHPESVFYLFLSDDVIVSKLMLLPMVRLGLERKVIINPMCNGDQGGRFLCPDLKLPITADLGEIDPALIEERSGPIDLVVCQDWLSFYCTLIRRDIWKEVGLLDERLETRHNDQDFCYRARRLGIQCVIHFGSLAFHYGSKTLSITNKPGEQEEASRIFQEKLEEYHSGGF